jgi:predicted Zn-dependent protease with MMP-like domain
VSTSRHRDRHGRGLRGPLAWPRVPIMLSPSRQFDELVLDAVSSIERRLGRSLEDLEVAVEDVPPSDPAPWESRVALGRLFPAEGNVPARVVLYRRPLETRAVGGAELATLVHEVLAEQVAAMLGQDPEDLL